MPTPPQASLYIATGCSHCPTVLDALSQLTKEGAISRLEVTNLSLQPDAAEPGIRSVPWCRIGPFELTGAKSYSELARWAASAASKTGMSDYFSELLDSGELDKAINMIRDNPETIGALLPLVATLDTPMAIRIGIGAVFESIAEEGMLSAITDELIELSQLETTQVRADAAHYLGISGDSQAIPVLQKLLDDSNPEVQEIAQESLDLFNDNPG